MRRILALALALSVAPAANAVSGPEELQRFFREVTSYTASFRQVILDETLQSIDESTGRMWIVRPGRFRWNYDPPATQQIISDGDRVWVYDAELEQVTVRQLDDAVGSTPALLLAGEGDIDGNYEQRDLGQLGPVVWVGLQPYDRDSGFEDIRIGFEDGDLRLLELVDGFGQVTRITLLDTRANEPVDPALLDFVPPPGVDVIDEGF
jgi:outer membrane lipoprotein carrier protein